MAGTGEVGFEEGTQWLPSHVLHEAAAQTKGYMNHEQIQHHRRRLRLRPGLPLPSHIKPTSIHRNNRTTASNRWHSDGSGMQAIFLDSGRGSGGTGVFLPRSNGSNFQPTKKPACAPVLLPSRVVQALNLNVHALSLHISPKQESISKTKQGECELSKNVESNVASEFGAISQERSSSPDIFLPKEWTY